MLEFFLYKKSVKNQFPVIYKDEKKSETKYAENMSKKQEPTDFTANAEHLVWMET